MMLSTNAPAPTGFTSTPGLFGLLVVEFQAPKPPMPQSPTAIRPVGKELSVKVIILSKPVFQSGGFRPMTSQPITRTSNVSLVPLTVTRSRLKPPESVGSMGRLPMSLVGATAENHPFVRFWIETPCTGRAGLCGCFPTQGDTGTSCSRRGSGSMQNRRRRCPRGCIRPRANVPAQAGFQ